MRFVFHPSTLLSSPTYRIIKGLRIQTLFILLYASFSCPYIKYGSYINSRFVEDASYLRLQNIELGYSLPLKKWGNVGKYIQNCRISVGAQNLFTITQYSGFNPEVSVNGGSAVAQGLDFSSYPAYKMYNVGIKVTF